MYRSGGPWTLGIRGFKSLGAFQQLVLSPLTVLLGPNSAGKSTILEALRLLVRTVHAPNARAVVGWPLDSKRFQHLAHEGDVDAGFEIRLTIGPVASGGDEPWHELRSVSVAYTVEPWTRGEPVPRHALTVEDAAGFLVRFDERRLAWNPRHPAFERVVSRLRRSLEQIAGHRDGLDLAMELFGEAMADEIGYEWPHRSRTRWTRANPRYEEAGDPDFFLGAFLACELAIFSDRTSRTIELLVAAIGVAGAAAYCAALEVAMDSGNQPIGVEDVPLDLAEEVEAAALELTEPWNRRTRYEAAVRDLRRSFELLLSDLQTLVPTVHHVPPMRDVPPSVIHEERNTDRMETPPRVTDVVNRWLGSDRVQRAYRFVREPLVRSDSAAPSRDGTLAPDRRRKEPIAFEQYLVDLRSGVRLGFEDVGFGISQVLPVLMALGDHYRGDGVLNARGILEIEQPEAHLHPARHGEVADEMIRAVRYAGAGCVLLAETHSEHLVLRLLRRVRETSSGTVPDGLDLRPEGLTLAFIDAIDGEVRIRHVGVSEDGGFLDPWPYGFFPERLEELG